MGEEVTVYIVFGAFFILCFAIGITSSNSHRFLHKMADDEWKRNRRIEDETGEKPDDSKWSELNKQIRLEEKQGYIVIGALFLLLFVFALVL